MMKFFRKYNKTLLAVFGVLLMIVFVGGSALDNLMRAGGAVSVAESALGTITDADQRGAQATGTILERMGQSWRRPFGGVGKPLTETDWILLTREAEELGTTSTIAAVKSGIVSPIAVAQIELVAHRLRIKPEQVMAAMAELQSVRSATLAIADATAPSEAEVRTAARNALDKVRINMVTLPAVSFVAEHTSISESQLEAHFSKYAETEPGEGLHFGYFLPPSTKIQYAKIDRQTVLEGVAVADLQRKARDYYNEHRDTSAQFARPILPGIDDVDHPPGAPVVRPSPFLNWEEVKDIAIERVREKQANEATVGLANWLLRYAGERWAEASRGDDGYKVPPPQCPECTALDFYETAASRIPRDKARLEAVSVVTTDFFSADEVGDLLGIGTAAFRPRRGEPITLGELVPRNQGLIPKIPTGDDVKPSDYLALFETCKYPLTDASGNVYVFRVIDAREAHKPESLADVRNRVIQDVRLLRGFEAAKEASEILAFNAVDVGLDIAFDELDLTHLTGQDQELEEDCDEDASQDQDKDVIVPGYFTPLAFARVERYWAPYGRMPDGMKIPGGLGKIQRLPNDVVDRCFDLGADDGKIATVELKGEATVLVTEWVRSIAGREEEFEGMRERLAIDMSRYRAQLAVTEWLDPAKIRVRNDLRSSNR